MRRNGLYSDVWRSFSPLFSEVPFHMLHTVLYPPPEQAKKATPNTGAQMNYKAALTPEQVREYRALRNEKEINRWVDVINTAMIERDSFPVTVPISIGSSDSISEIVFYELGKIFKDYVVSKTPGGLKISLKGSEDPP